jgi:heavy metal-(Cd/Co/Hg/Pb/Zn)-translocating P-type ATPase
MTKKQKRMLNRIFLSIALFGIACLIPAEGIVKLLIFMVPYLFIGWDVLRESAENILKGEVFDENFLMALATVGAFAIGEYPEATFVMLFYQVGEWFQDYAVNRSRKSITDLMDIRPDTAHVEKNGTVETVNPNSLQIGDMIVVRPGEKVPVDGVVVEGVSQLDTAALTGESMPREAAPGAQVLSGFVNLSGVLRVKVEKTFGESTAAKILDMVENAAGKKAKAEHFITKFARVYTPIVVCAAVLVAVIPLFFGQMFSESLHRALIFLVISCPCALVISVPLSFFGGIGGASKAGVLIKGSNYLETLAKAKTVVMDKTGTLTKGAFSVVEIKPVQMDGKKLLELAAHAEGYSTHPISLSIQAAYGQKPDMARVSGVKEIAGQGIEAVVDGKTLAIGNDKLMAAKGFEAPKADAVGTVLYVAYDGAYQGYIVIADTLKPNAKKAIEKLKAMGIEKTVMLTGDEKATGEAVAKEVGIAKAYCGLLPEDKVAQVERLLKEQPKGESLVFVGDGINDAPVLTRADVGIAMGALGSDAAIEAADVVLMDDDPYKLCTAISLSKRTLAIVKQNIIFALGVKLLVMALGVFGIATMWEASFADVGVSVIAILNAMRAMKVKE